MNVTRYHPALVALHWIIALMLIIALIMGTFVLQEIPNTDPEKINALKGHMAGGILLLILTIIRLVLKVATSKPPKSTSDNPMLDKLGVAVHHSFYLFIVAMALTGMATSVAAGLPDIVFGGSGEPLPEDFFEFGPRIGHAIVAKFLMLLILLHVAGAFYHQFKLKDNLIARMKFGNRKQG